MLVALAAAPDSDLERQVRFALRLAVARGADLLCLVSPAPDSTRAVRDANAAARAKLLPALRAAVSGRDDYRLVEDEGTDPPPDDPASGTEPPPRTVRCAACSGSGPEALLAAVAEHRPATLVTVLADGDLDRSLARDGGRVLLQRAACELVLLRPGDGEPAPGLDVLVPVPAGPITQAALRVGHDLAQADAGKLIALLVEPPIGADAEAVGERVLRRRVARALGKVTDDVVAHVVVAGDEPDGVLRACDEDRPGLVVLGTSAFGGLGDREATRVARQLLRRRADLDVALVRAALPVTNRLRLGLEVALQRIVPQLEREQRVGLAERVQSSSTWDFDFVALISLAAMIAAMGLVQDSVAVVIGAMLVAPLMTPILGVGLALVHGNAALARLAARSIVFGVATAWVLGLLTGLVHPGLTEPTREMLARGWPHPIDLLVAFVSGLAAAYATSRPNLVSALPGVAIAASLVPPLASSGLFASLGHAEAAVGAFLLFLTNMVAIVLAAAVALWAVGIRSARGVSRWSRVVGNSLIAASLGLALYLGITPEHDVRVGRVPDGAADAIASRVAPGFRVIGLSVRPDQADTWLEVRLGGLERPDATLAAELGGLVRPFFADPVRVRVTAVHEVAEPADR